MFTITALVCIFVSVVAYFDDEKYLECNGKKFENVSLTAYFPDYDNEELEDSIYDKRGRKLKTLQDYLDDRSEYVTLSMDESLGVPYGSPVCIPELNEHFGHRIRLQVRDSSSDLYRKGYKRADICVRSEMDSYDVTVNRRITLVFERNAKDSTFLNIV